MNDDLERDRRALALSRAAVGATWRPRSFILARKLPPEASDGCNRADSRDRGATPPPPGSPRLFRP